MSITFRIRVLWLLFLTSGCDSKPVQVFSIKPLVPGASESPTPGDQRLAQARATFGDLVSSRKSALGSALGLVKSLAQGFTGLPPEQEMERLEVLSSLVRSASGAVVSLLLDDVTAEEGAELSARAHLFTALSPLQEPHRLSLLEAWRQASTGKKSLFESSAPRIAQLYQNSAAAEQARLVTAFADVLNESDAAEDVRALRIQVATAALALEGASLVSGALETAILRTTSVSLNQLRLDLGVARTLPQERQSSLISLLKGAADERDACDVLHTLGQFLALEGGSEATKASTLAQATEALGKTGSERATALAALAEFLSEALAAHGNGESAVSYTSTENLLMGRTYLQTRSLVHLGFASDVIANGDDFSLVNATLGRTLAAGVFGAGRVSIAGVGHPYWAKRFSRSTLRLGATLAYGNNAISLRTRGLDSAWAIPMSVVLRDFEIFAFPGTTFGSTDPQEKDGFQGWLAPLGAGIQPSSDGTTLLLTGFGPIVNY